MNHTAIELEYFAEVAETLNIPNAAAKLGITQSMLSAAIVRLEKITAKPLVVRRSSGLQLTLAGQQLAHRLREMQSFWQEMSATLAPSPKPLTGIFRLGCHPVVGQATLPFFLPDLLAGNPHLGLDLTHDSTGRLAERVVAGELDVGISINPQPQPQLHSRAVYTDTIRIWRRARGKVATALYFDPQLEEYERILRSMGTVASRFRQRVATGDLSLVAQAVAQGAGYGILPTAVVASSATARELVSSPAFPSVDMSITLVWRPHPNRELAALIHAMGDAISEASLRWSLPASLMTASAGSC